MVILTQSLEHWLFVNHKEKLPLIMFGHTELFTEEMQKEYIEWCKTDEGKQFGMPKHNQRQFFLMIDKKPMLKTLR